MTPDEFNEQHSAMQEERRYLASLAFRILGSVVSAEDAVQESYISWYYLTAEEQDAVESTRAWLTRAVSRACLSKLMNAHRQRAHNGETWMPKSAPDEVADPKGQALPDSLMWNMAGADPELPPGERVALVLRDGLDMSFVEIAEVLGFSPAECERITDAARRRTTSVGEPSANSARRDVVAAFASAAQARDKSALLAVMDPAVELAPSVEWRIEVIQRRIFGAIDASRYLLTALRRCPTVAVLEQEAPDGPGLALWEDGRIVAAIAVDVRADAVTSIRLQ